MRRISCFCNFLFIVIILWMDFWVVEINDVMDLMICFILLFCVSIVICRYLYWFKMVVIMDWWVNMDLGGYFCKILILFFNFMFFFFRFLEVMFRVINCLFRIFLVFCRIWLVFFNLFRVFVLKFLECMVLLLWVFWLVLN